MTYDDESVEVTWGRGIFQQNKVTNGDMGDPINVTSYEQPLIPFGT